MGKTVAITGINSYFASTLLPRLQADPEVERIIGIDMAPWKGGFDKVDFHKEDIRSDKIVNILKGVDTVYHLAFLVAGLRDKKKTTDININGSKNVFEACVKNKVQKVVYTSSLTVYGAFKDTTLYLKEETPLRINKGSHYNNHKVAVENFVNDFFKNYPQITLTVMRAGLLFGPKINNIFSQLFELPLTGNGINVTTHNQLIHEEDLGEALHLALKNDLPGTYNVAADDAMSTLWAYKEAGVLVIPMPKFMLKLTAIVGYATRLFPFGSGWVTMAAYTILVSNDKFKKATGWQPKYSSEAAFLTYLESRKKKAKDNPIQAVLSWVYRNQGRTKLALNALHIFKLGYVPGVRKLIPWMDPKKNSMTYLPVNQSLISEDEVLPKQVVHDFIEESKYHVIMNSCGCRLGRGCENYTHTVACLFMGETAMKMPPGVSRSVTKEEAHAHVEKAVDLGLIPMTGKVRVDNFIFLTPDKSKLLSVCFCCHCCCMMRDFRHMPNEQLDEVMPRIEGFNLSVTDKCQGCGTCVETCGFKAIKIENGKAVHNGNCRGCGRCERSCPNSAVTISIDNPNATEDVKKRIRGYVEIS